MVAVGFRGKSLEGFGGVVCVCVCVWCACHGRSCSGVVEGDWLLTSSEGPIVCRYMQCDA